MEDRISIQFKDKYGLSPYLYSHWAGMSLVDAAKEFAATFNHPYEGVGEAMVQFIRSNYAASIDDLHIEFADGGDNDDNGNYVIDLETKQSFRTTTNKIKPTKDEIKAAQDCARAAISRTIYKIENMRMDLEKDLASFSQNSR